MVSTLQPSLTCDLLRKRFYRALNLHHHHYHHYCIAAHVTNICCLLLMIKWTKGVFSTTLEKFSQSQNCCWLSIPFLRIFSEILLIILIMMDINSISIFFVWILMFIQVLPPSHFFNWYSDIAISIISRFFLCFRCLHFIACSE